MTFTVAGHVFNSTDHLEILINDEWYDFEGTFCANSQSQATLMFLFSTDKSIQNIYRVVDKDGNVTLLRES